MPISQKPQPTRKQVDVMAYAIELYADTDCTLRPGMYRSGTMLLTILRAGIVLHVIRFNERGMILSIS